MGGFKREDVANYIAGMAVENERSLDALRCDIKASEGERIKLYNANLQLEAEKKELETFRTEKANKELIDKITNAKIDNKYAKFVLSEINSMVDDNNKFDDVLAKYVKDNPQYLVTRQGVLRFGTLPDLEKGNSPVDNKSTNQTMNDIIRNRGEN